MKRILSWLCTIVLVMQMVIAGPVNVYATDNASVVVSTVTAKPGDTSVEVTVELSDNPGICGMILKFAYDEGLTLVDVKQGEALSTLTLAEFAKPYLNPLIASWDGATGDSTNGVVLKLYFNVDAAASAGIYNIIATYDEGDIYDNDLNDLVVDITNGSITVEAVTHVHDMEYTSAKEATCIEAGNVEYWYCSGCDAYYSDAQGKDEINVISIPINPKNHKGETEVRGAFSASCGEDGYTGDVYCLDCGTKIADGEVIPATGDHVDADGKWESDGTNHWHTCTCTEIFDIEAHKGGEATCIAKAECSVCEAEYGEFDPDNHVNTEVRGYIAPTEETEGYTGDVYCLDCTELVKTGKVIPVLAHTHKPVRVWKSDADYHWHECSDCEEQVDKAEHAAGNWIIDEQATENKTGLKHKECVVCGYVLETEDIPVVDSGFDFNDWYWILAQLMNQKFTVTAEAGEGGFISNEGKTTVKYNNSITYYITPAEGYDIDAVHVNGRNIGATNEYTFKNVRSNQTISVTFVRTAWDNPFIDIADDAEYIDAIEFVYENGLFKGVSDIEFAPETTMTRAMFVTVLGRLADVNAAYYTDSSFEDVVEGEWYSPYVEWAAEKEIVLGYGDGRFGVNDKITVEQAAVILARYAEYVDEYEESDISLKKYADADKVSDWALDAMKWAVENDIYNGESRRLNPQKPAPRALIATMIYNYAKEFEGEE